jgi:long-chain acyl-CoA synthetase
MIQFVLVLFGSLFLVGFYNNWKRKNIKYSFEYQPSSPGQSSIQRSLISRSQLLGTLFDNITTLYELLFFSFEKFSDYPCIGWRDLIKEHKEQREITKKVQGKEIKEKRDFTLYEMSPFKWITYKQYGSRVENVASGLVSSDVGVSPRSSTFGIFCNTCPEWLLILHACCSQSVTISTSYSNLGEEGLEHSINQVGISHLFTSSDLLTIIARIKKNCPSLKVVIHKDKVETKMKEELNKLEIKLISIEQVEEIGSKNPVKANPPKPEDNLLIMYTSGTTGAPKGVIISHKNILSVIASGFKCADIYPSDRYVGYLPLAHVLELVIENAMFLGGASIGYGQPRTLTGQNMKNSFGDIKELKPSLMCGVPEVWERIRKGSIEKIQKNNFLVRSLFNTTLSLKKFLYPYFGLSIPVLDIIFKPFRNEVGGNLRLILSGGAPISNETQNFIRTCCSCNLIQGYGLTETCGLICIQLPSDLSVGTIGGPAPCNELKLVDIPEMGYTSQDKPNPRGEILVRGLNVTNGYFNNEDSTKEVYIEGGWFATGDVGELLPNGTMKVIDRKKNLVKLAAGEYIALERLESLYKHCEFVENICIYADSSKNFPIAVVVPNRNNLEKYSNSQNIHEVDYKTLCQNEKIVSALMNSLRQVAKDNKLTNFENIQGIYVTPDEWTPENDMLTPAFKIKRRNIFQKYKEQIEKIYE